MTFKVELLPRRGRGDRGTTGSDAATLEIPGFRTARFGNHRGMSSSTVAHAPVAPRIEHELEERRPAGERSGRRAAAAVVVVGYLVVVSSFVLFGLLLTHVLLDGTLGRWDEVRPAGSPTTAPAPSTP